MSTKTARDKGEYRQSLPHSDPSSFRDKVSHTEMLGLISKLRYFTQLYNPYIK